MDQALVSQLNRLIKSSSPRVLDIFAGCGGISLGFERASCRILGGVDLDPEAARSHALNFHADSPRFDKHAEPRDMLTAEPEEVLREWGEGEPVDILVGGPPCQAFTRIGRAKLRSLNGEDAHESDPRARLYERYLHWVEKLRPLALVMENVPDMMNFGGRNVARDICEKLETLGPGYVARYAILNAAHYGVPQSRERCLIVALRRDLGAVPRLPAPTHHFELPLGYRQSRRVSLKLVELGCQYFAPPAQPEAHELADAVTAQDALGDLPVLRDHLVPGGKAPGATMPASACVYTRPAREGEYAYLMRTWRMQEPQITRHVSRQLPRDYGTFALMPCGAEYPVALQVAKSRFDEHYAMLCQQGKAPAKGSPEYEAEKRKFVPPYSADKFANKWWKLRPDAPSRTLTAHIGKDTYSHIHYDGEQARTITVREAARLQSFPDGFVFEGGMNAAFRQIGNSVPPLLAYAVAKQLRHDLLDAVRKKIVEAAA